MAHKEDRVYRLDAFVINNQRHDDSLPENSHKVRVYPIEGRLGYGTDECQVEIDSIAINYNKHVVITPKVRPIEGDFPLGATQLAVLLHEYNIATSPEAVRNYGAAVDVEPGQLPRLLGVLVKNGLGVNIAEAIAHANAVEIPPARGIRRSKWVGDENTYGNRIIKRPSAAAGPDVDGNVKDIIARGMNGNRADKVTRR